MPRKSTIAAEMENLGQEESVKKPSRKKEGVQRENRDFRLHRDILWSIIQQQAGTIGKAVLELVMNSVDAGATSVKIVVTSGKISVSDDGKGFVDRREIEEFFETFGTPHKEGDATYGRFRMGRGQIMAFSRNIWNSGEFRMDVDIKNNGLNYVLETRTKKTQGCSVDAELYEKLNVSEVISLRDQIRNLCRYTPIPVFVNGERISLELDKQKWSMEDENAYYLFREGRSLEVYNLGVHVKDYYSGDYGVGGIIVSKKQLNVNFARNDILVNKCGVWKEIAAVLRKREKKERKSVIQNEAWREVEMANLVTGRFQNFQEFYDAFMENKIFTDYSGKHYSLHSVNSIMYGRGRHLVSVSEESHKADRVNQHKLAFVLSPKVANRLDFMPFSELIERIRQHVKEFSSDHANTGERYANRPARFLNNAVDQLLSICGNLEKALVPLEVVASSINDNHDIVDEKTLDKESKIVLGVLRENAYVVAAALETSVRKLGVCSSETVKGFTDGKVSIFIERELLKIRNYGSGSVFAAFDKLKYLLVHEYAHDSLDATGHGHPPEFYERVHDVLSSDALTGFTVMCVKSWFKARRRAGMEMKFSDKDAANALFFESDEQVA